MQDWVLVEVCECYIEYTNGQWIKREWSDGEVTYLYMKQVEG